MVEITVRLPDALVRQAKAKGLLGSASLERMLREQIRRKQTEGLFAVADRLAAAQLPPMTEEEIQAEIKAVRRMRRKAHASGR